MLQVYLKYTWAKPENTLGPYLEKYVISIYLEKYTSRIFLQVLFQDTWSKYASSILTKVLFKHCSRRGRQVYLKESWRSTYLAKYAGSTSSMVLVEDLLEVYLKRSWTGILQAYLAKYAVSTTLLGSNHRPLEYMSTYKTTELLDLRTHISHKGPYYTYRVLFQVYFTYTWSRLVKVR